MKMNRRLAGFMGLAMIMAAAAQSNDVYGIPKPVSNGGNGATGKIPSAGKAPKLHEFTIQGHTVMAENRTKAIKILIKQGKIKDKKKK